MTIISSRYDIENNIANIDVGFEFIEISSQNLILFFIDDIFQNIEYFPKDFLQSHREIRFVWADAINL